MRGGPWSGRGRTRSTTAKRGTFTRATEKVGIGTMMTADPTVIGPRESVKGKGTEIITTKRETTMSSPNREECTAGLVMTVAEVIIRETETFARESVTGSLSAVTSSVRIGSITAAHS